MLRPLNDMAHTKGKFLAASILITVNGGDLDDEKLVYPFYEKARKSGVNKIIRIHKGLLPRD